MHNDPIELKIAELDRDYRINGLLNNTMKYKTIEELRDQAKALGLKGYSALRKQELLQLLARKGAKAKMKARKAPSRARKPSAAKSAKTTAASRIHKKRSRATHKTRATISRAQTPPAKTIPLIPGGTPSAGEEARAEEAKYAIAPPGVTVSAPPTAPDLGEDIERLPAFTESTLCLLPQKPGILHAYWVLEPGRLARQPSLKLRLCLLSDDTFEVLEEIPLTSDHGHWYFDVNEVQGDGEIVLQLGAYQDGTFIPAIRRGMARIPSLYASSQTDRKWWVSEQRFREMYLRAGGFARGRRLGWSASLSSR